jgi:uncharacterized protein involved in exopolysaccharide biosynthesis
VKFGIAQPANRLHEKLPVTGRSKFLMSIYEDEIDLRPYILALIRTWWRIALIAFLAALVALGFSLLQSKEYVSTATILLTRSRASLNLAEQFPTITENIYDASSRMDALLSLAKSDAIASETLLLIGDKLPEDNRKLESIKSKIAVSNKGDSIWISASAENPELAAEIANAWAGQTVLTLNRAYSGDQPLAAIQSRLTAANQDYENAQSALEAFIQNNRITLLEKKIDEATNSLSEAINDRAWQISYYYNRKQSMQDLKVKAEALKQQLSSGNRSSAGSIGDAIALLNMHSNAFGLGETSNARALWLSETSDKAVPDNASRMTYNLQLTELSSLDDTASSYADDLDPIIQQADAEISKADKALSDSYQDLFQGASSDLVDAIGVQIQQLETQLESEQARQRELTSARDLTWEAYQALVQKQTEIENTPQTNSQVTLASQAIPPQKPTPRGALRNTLVAGVLGGFLGVFWVLGSMWWKTLDQSSRPEKPLTMVDQSIK